MAILSTITQEIKSLQTKVFTISESYGLSHYNDMNFQSDLGMESLNVSS